MGTGIPAGARSWADVVAALGRLPSNERGELFEQLTEFLLRIDPVYRQKLRRVWRHQEVPPAVRRKLSLPRQDIGIDLVAETTTGDYWAIQCKHHDDPHQNLTLNELRPFLHTAHTVCRGRFAALLVASTANGYAPTLRRHAPEIQYILGDTFRSLDAEFFRGVRALLRRQAPRLVATKPRPHQRRAVRNAVKHFAKDGETRGKLIHPCGSGKSLTAFWIAEALGPKSVLVAVPSLQLVRQQLSVWARESLAKGMAMEWIAVCSEGRIGAVERDDPALHLQDLGIQVTTDAKELAAFLKRDGRAIRVVFTTYQSGRVVSRATRAAGFAFDLGIYDEAHKTVGAEAALFGELLSDDRVQVRRRVFMTATERRYRGESDRILSMDDQRVYGDAFDVMTFREALEQDPPILSDYRIITCVVTKAEVRDLLARNLLVRPDSGEWGRETEARTLAAVVALRKSMKRHRFSHVLSFHSSVAKARAFRDTQARFSEAVPGFGALDSFHVSGRDSTGERQERIGEFVGAKRALMTNARCLTEGVDVPRIDAVLFADPKRSTVDIVQAVGRALRRAKGKKLGYVIVPVLVDEKNPNAADEAYADILLTLRALASQDDRIIEWFRSVAQGKRPTGRKDLFEIDVPEAMEIDLKNFVASVETKAWSRLAKLSWRPFEEAREFAHSLSLGNSDEWNGYAKASLSGKPLKPADIPSNPQLTYRDKGWAGMGDWLGTGNVRPGDIEYRPLSEAREFARRLHLRGYMDWTAYLRGERPDRPAKPKDIPASPQYIYRSRGWLGWGDWLGTGNVHRGLVEYRAFRQARRFVRGLDLRTHHEYGEYCKSGLPGKPPKPSDIPAAPDKVYRGKGWISWGDWLGTGKVASGSITYRSFEQAREYVRSLALHGGSEWWRYCRGGLPDRPARPQDLPTNPQVIYMGKGWISWGDWFGTGSVSSGKIRYRPFGRSRDFARCLGLSGQREWNSYCRGSLPDRPPKPADIPACPAQVYRSKGWASWGDWLGTGHVHSSRMVFLPFTQARAFSRSLGLRGEADWRRYCRGELPDKPRKPADVPASPRQVYGDKGWMGWGNWLGTDNKRCSRRRNGGKQR